jgi:hypothetical protein
MDAVAFLVTQLADAQGDDLQVIHGSFPFCFLLLSPGVFCWLAAGAVLDNTAGLLRAEVVFFFLSQLTDFEADDLQVIHFLSPFVDKIKFCFSFLTIV